MNFDQAPKSYLTSLIQPKGQEGCLGTFFQLSVCKFLSMMTNLTCFSQKENPAIVFSQMEMNLPSLSQVRHPMVNFPPVSPGPWLFMVVPTICGHTCPAKYSSRYELYQVGARTEYTTLETCNYWWTSDRYANSFWILVIFNELTCGFDI